MPLSLKQVSGSSNLSPPATKDILMPFYEYKCAACQNKTTKRQSYSAEKTLECEECKNIMHRQIPKNFTFNLKGSGWSKPGIR